MKALKSIYFILIMVVFASCKNDDDVFVTPQNQDPNPTTFSQNFGSEITRTFLGTVVDTDKNPIEGVAISIGSSTAMTDSNGVFIINNATVNERFGYVKAEKVGYIHASRAVVPSEGTNKVRIMMLPETVAGSTSSGTQETISLGNGASVALEGDYIKPDGTVYDGNVNVIMHHLDPIDENMQDQMPGMLYAANAQNEERMLQTFGMLAVELRGENGEDLNLAEGSTAEITVPLDASLVTDAPATIPLWYFDEDHGYWIEDGFATLIGNTYVGTVSHFSFWNCDIPAEAVNLCINVKDENGNSVSGLIVQISSNQYGTRGGYTNENGDVCGLVPSNEILEINIYPSGADACLNNLYNGTIGPFSSDSSISITVSSNGGEWLTETIIGNFTDCTGNPVTEGYVRLYRGSSLLDVDFVENGEFELSTIRCSTGSNTFRIHAVDYVNTQETDSISYTYTSPITNIGTIASCNTIDEFVQYSIDGGDSIIFIENISTSFESDNSQDGSGLNIYATDASQQNCFYLFGRLDDTDFEGTYDYLDWNDNNDTGFNIGECLAVADTNNNITFNLTSIGDIDAFIDINFSGSYQDYDGNPHTINGVIHVLRDQ